MITRSSRGLTRLMRPRAALSLLGAAAVIVVAAGPALAADTPQAHATAVGANVNVPGSLYVTPNPASADNDGSGSTTPVVIKPGPLPNSTFVPSTGPQAEVAQAGTDGTSYACAGQGGIVFALSSTCQVTAGASSTILRLDQIPVVGNALASTPCPRLRLSYRFVSAHAADAPGIGPVGDVTTGTFSGDSCTNASETSLCRNFSLSIGSSPNTDILAAYISAMSSIADCAPIVAALQGIQDKVEFQLNHQTTASDGTFRVDALHFATIGGDGSGFDIGTVTVGPNSVPVVDTPMVSATTGSVLAGVVALTALGGLAIRRRWVRAGS